MKLLLLTLLSAVSVLTAPSERDLLEKEVAKQLDLEELAVDKRILSARVAEEAAATAEETKELLSHIAPLPNDVADAEQDSEAVNAEIEKVMVEGDMILTTKQLEMIVGHVNDTDRSRRQAFTSPGYYPANIWGTKTIPFSFDSSTSEEVKRIFRSATRFWSTHTCVNFGENASGYDRIEVFSGDGCYSNVGRVGGKQQLSLSNDGCNWFATATHELEHALGVFHEQSRSDRHEYVDINFDNIIEDDKSNFARHSTIDTSSFNVPYEFGSNMHYHPYSFAVDSHYPTIFAKPAYKNYQSSMRGHMPSFLDVLLVNRFYGCDQQCESKTNFCQNGGYLDVRTCSKCVCPEGWGGRDCTGKPDGCLVELAASTSFQRRSIKLGDGRDHDDFQTCSILVTAPPGKRIQLVFNSVQGFAMNGCYNNGIEVKPSNDLRPRGLRNCGVDPKPADIVSQSNRLPILVYARAGQIHADVQYKYY